MRVVESLNKLPEPDQIRWLYEQYFNQGEPSGAMSSHWAQFSRKFRVEIDPAGAVHDLSGAGFGDYSKRGALGRLLDVATVASYLAVLNGRVGLMRTLARLRKQGIPTNYDSLRQAGTALFLRDFLAERGVSIQSVLLIGDGYGVLTSVLKEFFPGR